MSLNAKVRVLNKYGDAEAAFLAPSGELALLNNISLKEAEELERHKSADMAAVEDECALQGIRIVSMQDAAYPARLKHIFAPPPILYVKGELPAVDENALIAVVGTRRASPYGLKMGRELAYQIAEEGGIVVSGLTNGVDAQAARGALLAGGRCVAVLGTPHELETSRLAADVAAHGAVISEYAPGTRPMRSFFRDRNRISAGISVGVVAVEAPEHSGTLLFVEEAAEQGKEIFAVPGNADNEVCAGTNALIRDGARLVSCGWDVMSEFCERYPGKIKRVRTVCPPEENAAQEPPVKPVSDKKAIDKEKRKGYIDLKEQLSALSEEQLRIITAIEDGGSHIDDIIETSGLSAAKVLAQLTVLEIKGYVRRGAGRRILLNIAKK